MNIQEIKAAAGIKGTLMLVQQKDKAGITQPWVSHWQNDTRTRVSMHDEVFKLLKEDPNYAKLAYKMETVQPTEADKQPYNRYVVITPKDVVGTF